MDPNLDEKLTGELVKTGNDAWEEKAAKAAFRRRRKQALKDDEVLPRVLDLMKTVVSQKEWGSLETPPVPPGTVSGWCRRPGVVKSLARVLNRFLDGGPALAEAPVVNSNWRTCGITEAALHVGRKHSWFTTEYYLSPVRRKVKGAVQCLLHLGAYMQYIYLEFPDTDTYTEIVEAIGLTPEAAVKLRRLAMDVADNDQSA